MPYEAKKSDIEQIKLWDVTDRWDENEVQHKHDSSKMEKPLRGISLFTGASGMDVGFTNAGIRVVAANEIVPYACETYAANHPETKLLKGDIKDYIESFSEGDADIIFGGPPCQGFSVAGKMDPDPE